MEDTFKFYVKGEDTLYTYRKINKIECVITYEVDGTDYTHYTYIQYIKQGIESGNIILAETKTITLKYYFKDNPTQEFTYTSDGDEWATLSYKTHNLGRNTKIKIDDFKELVESGDVIILYSCGFVELYVKADECVMPEHLSQKDVLFGLPSIYELIQDAVKVTNNALNILITKDFFSVSHRKIFNSGNFKVFGEDNLRKILPLLIEIDKVLNTNASKTS